DTSKESTNLDEGRRQMNIRIFDGKEEMARAAAGQAAAAITRAIADTGAARIIAATGASQFEFLEVLTSTQAIDWGRVEMFHLDEYIGLPADHPASFRKYLLARLIHKTGIRKHHLIDGEADPREVIATIGRNLKESPIHVAFVGVGENGHLAFND